MFPNTSPETSGAIRALLTDLRNRKAALDEAIASLERYAVYAMPPDAVNPRRAPKVVQMKGDARFAGAAYKDCHNFPRRASNRSELL
jgi:hypothetical protein